MMDPPFLASPTLLADLRRAFAWALPARAEGRRGHPIPPPHARGPAGGGRIGLRRATPTPAARRKVVGRDAARIYFDPPAGRE